MYVHQNYLETVSTSSFVVFPGFVLWIYAMDDFQADPIKHLLETHITSSYKIIFVGRTLLPFTPALYNQIPSLINFSYKPFSCFIPTLSYDKDFVY